MTPARVAIGTPLMPGLVNPGEDVVFIGCGHEEPCPETVRPCSVGLYGTMEFYRGDPSRQLQCRVYPDGFLELFDLHEVSTPEAVAAYAARTLDEEQAA